MRVTVVRSRAIDPAVNKIAKALSEHGHNVKLLVWDRTCDAASNTQLYLTHTIKLKAPHDKFGVMFYLPLWWFREFFFLLKDDSEVLHVCDLDTLLPAILVKLIKRVKLCYTIYDFYADNLPSTVPHFLRKSIAVLERLCIGFTDILFLVDERRYEQVEGSKIHMLVYIYNSAPDVCPHANLPQRVRATSETTILYAGLIHKSRGLEYLIKAISELNNVQLVLAGKGPFLGYLEGHFGFRDNGVRYIGQISYEEVIRRTMEADILVAFYDPSIPNNRYASPNKLFEAMMCGKPIIINSETSASQIVREENSGLVVPYGDVEALKDAIATLSDAPQLAEALGQNGRRAYETKYGWPIMEKRLIQSYKTLA
jgi:glycosyltransferase involved in cell wall biosynthesis